MLERVFKHSSQFWLEAADPTNVSCHLGYRYLDLARFFRQSRRSDLGNANSTYVSRLLQHLPIPHARVARRHTLGICLWFP